MYDWKDVTTLAPGAGSGNVTTPIIGQDAERRRNRRHAEQQDQHAGHQRLDHGQPVRAPASFIGNYIKADGSNETSYVEADAGKFVSFEIARFFAGLGETVNSRSRTDYWRASARAEMMLAPERRPRRRLGREQAACSTARP